MSGTDVLVPVRESVTLRQTVAYVANRVNEARDEVRPTIHFVYPLSRRIAPGDPPTAERELLDRVAIWAREDLEGAGSDDEEGSDEIVTIETAIVGEDQYLFDPRDYADVLVEYATTHDLAQILLDPEFNPSGMTPLIPTLEVEIERRGIDAEIAPVERPARRFPLVRRASLGQFVVLFAWAYGFYLLVAGSLASFELLTGAVSGLLAATILWRISLRGSVSGPRLAGRLVRMALYVPYLLWEIVKANFQIAYVVLHPKLPIDPEVVEFDAAVWAELPVTTLANSITLTPGTLTVDVTRRHFTVHTITEGARQGLYDGGLERAVRFVFYGRSAARIASPAERGTVGPLDESESPDETTGDQPIQTDPVDGRDGGEE